MSSEKPSSPGPGRPIKLGIIGAGNICQQHIKGIAEYRENFELVALCDPSDARCDERQKQLEELGFSTPIKRFADCERMFSHYEQGKLDAVIVATPFKYHPGIVKAAAARGVHVLVEKPFAVSSLEGRDVLRAVDQADIIAMVGHVQLQLPAVRKTKTLIAEGKVGKLIEIICRDCFIHPSKGLEGTWRVDARGGVLMDTGIHPLSRLLFLADSLDVTHVEGKGINRTTRLTNGPDEVELFVEFSNGVTGHMLTSWCRPLESCGARIEVIGTEGMLWSGRGYDDLYYQSFTPDSVLEHIEIADNANPFVTQMNVFANSLRNGKLLPSAHGVHEAQRILEIIEMSGVLAPFIAV